MSTSRLAAGLLALTLGAAACTSDGDGSATPSTDLSSDDIELTAALVTVDSCDALLDRIKAEASERVGPYGFGDGGPIVIMEDDAVAMEAGAEGAPPADPATAERSAATSAPAGESQALDQGGGEGGDEGFSGTNNQEAGVDEADLVKTDGRRLVVASGNRVEVIDVRGDRPRLVDTIELPEDFYGSEMFLSGDTALLMSSGWTAVPFMARASEAVWFPGAPTGRIVEVDLATGKIGTTMEFEGAYLSAREVDGTIRIVLTATQNRFDFVYPSNPGAEDVAERANRELVADSTIDMWIPTYRITDASGATSQGPIVDCDRVHLPSEFAGFGSLVVLTASIDDGLELRDSLSVFTDAQTVYASPDRLAVATPRWPERSEDGTLEEDLDYTTAIHTFDISDPATTGYAASGSVRGHLLNQYSLSESDGYLRVATTDGTPWSSESSESFLTVLAEEGGDLLQVGQVGGLGRSEQIFAVRFLGDTAYVVTFRQTDPLYSIDLTDPANPRVRGELKIPGFSQYLHPFGEDHLIGIGTDGDEEGRTSGAVASLFDISDLDDPLLVDKVSLAPANQGNLEWYDSQSSVGWDPKAFNIWDDTIMVPVSWWGSGGREGPESQVNGAGLSLVAVDAAAGTLTPVGRVGHPVVEQCEGRPIPVEGDEIVVETDGFDFDRTAGSDGTGTEAAPTDGGGSGDAEAGFARPSEEPVVTTEAPAGEPTELVPAPDGEYCWSFQPEIRRSVIIGDELYTISEAGVAVNDFASLGTVTWIPFDSDR